ncbi:PREDICTED: nucleoporin NUP53 [Drosophila arizonae]|uniref:Nucleoporin NUP53 n=1 Tax=Drosophila arizonae TaxID=7263 RepID=A0ABM1PXX1_DROAR|nr:PREDICTED: nucleoporin NUP53 [Drosophila arizonae]
MEPMNLGSPVSSPGSNQSQYLPPFLMGDSQAMTPQNNTLSPKLGRYNISFATSPNNNTPQETSYNNPQQINRSAMGTRTLFAGGTSGPAGGGGNGGNASSANTSHQAGPPTQGLFDSLRNEQLCGTPHRTHLGMLQTSHLNSSNYSLNQSCQPPTTQLNDSYVPNAPNAVNASMRALCSPLGANMSPLNVPHTPQARNSDFWVTIFGFAPGASSMILQHFTMCGTIVDVVHAPQNGNWMHVRFASRIESDKALNYNLKVIANNVMVGVTRCTDESVINKENVKLVEPDAEAFRPKVRSLTQQSYNIAHNEIHVSPNRNVPQKSTGLVNKAMDLIFGW